MRPLCKDRSKGEALVSRKQESCLKLALSCLGALPSSPICPGDASFGKSSRLHRHPTATCVEHLLEGKKQRKDVMYGRRVSPPWLPGFTSQLCHFVTLTKSLNLPGPQFSRQ